MATWHDWLIADKRQAAFDEAYDIAMYDLLNGFAEPTPYFGEVTRRIRGWRWEQIRRRIFARDGYACQYCGDLAVVLECDHIIPVTRGGSNADDNLTTACFPCNRSKRTKLVSEWKGTA